MRELAKSDWAAFFGRLEPSLRARVVEVEASGLGLDVPADWVRLAELSYDAGSDVLEIAAHGGERRISHPASVRLRDEDGSLHSIEVMDERGERELVIFREPLGLPVRKS